ncbi:MAG: multifunctional CCA tRNA nucleotidyl transferase/2'3'-cyclic phosphodiesterase/2'nucleotidase/phosphatase [Pseudomonadota bacterium]|nr:multifunctional CCA tRNA nucleotidyl transferase/2'3'-cyclic phosphodiesterase/2'nucleotidase/phosphatase [Pseudomonadota bacterium]MEC8977379.1 multifunctional CCA tRNA nucleotidyl transferase/2'3'-cyclic phosphodiesterase/2'nucleotidase/phosphatase [Pseudomonadota bacterium]
MQVYLVGGAVRDELLGIEVKERDWVVVGSKAKEMIALGYKQVGKDFPVFLHPESGEEYALARTERKQGKGYTGFEVDANPAVTLEQDLMRRDLTINAIAKSQDGHIVDPYNGQRDLKNKVLRHVSSAFVEDPLRVLRLARFAAKLPEFKIAKDTEKYCIAISNSGEISHLTKERTWQEWQKTFGMKAPWRFIEVLQELQAWPTLMPYIAHPESIINVWKRLAGKVTDERLFMVIGLSVAPNQWQQQLNAMAVPKQTKEACFLVQRLQPAFHTMDIHDEDWLKNLPVWDAIRRVDRFQSVVELLGLIHQEEEKAARWVGAAKKMKSVKLSPELIATKQGAELADCLHQLRWQMLQKYRLENGR